jgi:exopolysaccharide biosynthesis polyprenyl glycosylphosphotransferase
MIRREPSTEGDARPGATVPPGPDSPSSRLPGEEIVAVPAADEVTASVAAAPVEQVAPLLGRLNERGFRLVMLADALVLTAVTVGGMTVRFGAPPWPSYPTPIYLVSFTIVIAIFMASFYFGGLYEREPRLGAPALLPRITGQTLAAGGMVALLNLALTGLAREMDFATDRALPFPIRNLIVLIIFGAVGVALNRRLVFWLRTRREGPPKVLLVGSGESLRVARKHLNEDRDRVEVVGATSTTDDLPGQLAASGATDVVLLDGDWIDSLYPQVLEHLERAGVTVLLRVGARETMFGLERVREVGGLPFVLLRSHTMQRSRMRYKRLLDLTLLVTTSLVWLPLLGLVALYQLIVAGRPLLFWQERVGAGGRPFLMVKFRTMIPDAEFDGRGPRLAERDDPRVIPACRWVRATRMDELPQLWNVLLGEMSLVGPRPERPELTATFEQDIRGYRRRHELPPGLTGLAQIHGRYHTDPEYKLGYDLQYLVNWSPVLDLQILVKTVWVVLMRRI